MPDQSDNKSDNGTSSRQNPSPARVEEANHKPETNAAASEGAAPAEKRQPQRRRHPRQQNSAAKPTEAAQTSAPATEAAAPASGASAAPKRRGRPRKHPAQGSGHEQKAEPSANTNTNTNAASGQKPAEPAKAAPTAGGKDQKAAAPAAKAAETAAAPRQRGRPRKHPAQPPAEASATEQKAAQQKAAAARQKPAAQSAKVSPTPVPPIQTQLRKAASGSRGGGRSSAGSRRSQPELKAAPGSEIKTAAQVAAAHSTSALPLIDLITPVASAGSRRRGRKPVAANKPKVRIIPLGGLGEVGKNLTVFECGNDAFIVDCGLTFPDESMPGVDLVIPDFTYVIENAKRIRGILITHGHEDHIGGIAYLLKHVNFPLYGTKLTLALVEGKLKEHGLLGKTTLTVQKPGDVVELGCMKAEFIGVNHSVPDACAFAIHTPVGIIVHTGDFKIDFTPIRGPVINLARFGELGSQGVLALMSDSTNAERPGATPSERTVGDSFDKLFAGAVTKRILVATFSSNVHRMQQIVDAAVKYKRKVAVFGRSMENVVGKALEIGYLEIPSGVLVDMDAIDKYPGDKMVIITTGSQGEPMSALTRMAMGDHRKVTVTDNDCIIISASPIPGNEKLVGKVINELMKLGAQVVYEKMYEIHVSGHACRDEQKMMLSLTKPKFFIPVHGEYKHLKKHADLAVSMGIDPKNVFIGENGRVLVTDGDTMGYDGAVTAGKVLVDGLGVGDVGSVVLRDRKHLAEDGLIIVVTAIDGESGNILAGPDIISRGFVYVKESEDMMAKVRAIAKDTITKCIAGGTREWGVIKTKIKDDVGNYLWQRTKRNPMVLPVVQEVR